MKEWYVDHLMEMLSQELDDHEDLTAPMLVVSSVSKNQFKQKELNEYTYQVRSLSSGGLHANKRCLPWACPAPVAYLLAINLGLGYRPQRGRRHVLSCTLSEIQTR